MNLHQEKQLGDFNDYIHHHKSNIVILTDDLTTYYPTDTMLQRLCDTCNRKITWYCELYQNETTHPRNIETVMRKTHMTETVFREFEEKNDTHADIGDDDDVSLEVQVDNRRRAIRRFDHRISRELAIINLHLREMYNDPRLLYSFANDPKEEAPGAALYDGPFVYTTFIATTVGDRETFRASIGHATEGEVEVLMGVWSPGMRFCFTLKESSHSANSTNQISFVIDESVPNVLPAKRAHLEKYIGKHIVAVNGQRVANGHDFETAKAGLLVGARVRFTIDLLVVQETADNTSG